MAATRERRRHGPRRRRWRRAGATPAACASLAAVCRSYLSVDPEKQRELYYMLVQSEEAPKDAPLLLWMQG